VLAGLQSDCVWWGTLVKSARVALRHASYVPVRIIPELAGSFFSRVGCEERRSKSFGFERRRFCPKGLCATALRYADSQKLCDKKADSLAAWNGGRNQAGTGCESRDDVAQGNATTLIDGRFPVEPVLLRQGGVNV
jgi:hypothetical protein